MPCLKKNFLSVASLLIFSLPGWAENAPDCPLPPGYQAVAREQAVSIPEIAPLNDWTVLNLWALWCAPCRGELPLLDQLAENQDEIAVYVINLNDDPEAVASLFQELGLAHLQPIISEDDTLLEQFNAIGLPFTAILDQGKVIASKSGKLTQTDDIVDFIHCKTGDKP